LFVLLLCVASGCSSQLTMVAPRPPIDYEVLGYAEGEATGSLISPLIGTMYYFIPAYLDTRTRDAYRNALLSVPGATGLINVTIDESWYWWVFGTSREVTVSGDAIRATSGRAGA
jgi:hypothetical protein